jgi:glutamine amidotransferase
MCRHLGYLGAPISLSALVMAPSHSLYEQSWAPRRQRYGTVNADGFGVGWYVPSVRAEPVRYRRGMPIWNDPSFASLAPTVSSGCVVAAVRSATAGYPADEANAAPFAFGRWLFSHNGRVDDWAQVRKLLPVDTEVPESLAPVDSAALFGLAVSLWRSGSSLGAGLVGVVSAVRAAGGGRVNLLASDGSALAATACGDTLFALSLAGGVVLASEPHDDSPAWQEIPDNSLVEVDSAGLRVTSLPS